MLMSRHNLAFAYNAVGRVNEAIDLYEQAITGYRRVLGDNHPLTENAAASLRAARREHPGQVETCSAGWSDRLTWSGSGGSPELPDAPDRPRWISLREGP